jgi:hypothetical protein
MSSIRSKRRKIIKEVSIMMDVDDFSVFNSHDHCLLDNTGQTITDICSNPNILQSHVDSENSSCFENYNLYDEESISSCASVDDYSFGSEVDDFLLEDELRHFIASENVNHTFIKGLLKVLQKYHPSLPCDPRTLMDTCASTLQLRTVYPGHYYHFGLCRGLQFVIPKISRNLESISLQLFVDGLPLFKSTVVGFWPILASISGYENTVFVVGLYYGEQKPLHADDYLKELIDETNVILTEGVQLETYVCTVVLRCICCDTPARAFIKSIKGHSGLFGCDKCDQEGKHMDHRMTFPDVDAVERTDLDFRHKNQPEHHHGNSPFERIPFINMVSSFPNDYMHSVCKGVTLSLLNNLRSGPIPYRLSSTLLENMSNELRLLRPQIPSDFQRRPRSMKHLSMWKATELRLFVIYLAHFILPNRVHPFFLQNFQCLSVLVRILCHPQLCILRNDYALDLAKTFIEQLKLMFGQQYITYNPHSLIHLVSDCKLYGSADTFSCFQYESFLQHVKHTVHSPNLPLQQAVNRVLERDQCLGHHPVIGKRYGHVLSHEIFPSHHHFDRQATFFKKCTFSETILNGKTCDGYVLTKDKRVFQVNYFAQSVDDVFLVGKNFEALAEAFSYPLSSQHLDIFLASEKAPHLESIPLSLIDCKIMCLYRNPGYLCMPILHTYNIWQ